MGLRGVDKFDDVMFVHWCVRANLRMSYGAAKTGSQRLTAQLDAVLGALDVLLFEAPADGAYGSIRARLEPAGQPIGANDVLIAAHAVAGGCVRPDVPCNEVTRRRRNRRSILTLSCTPGPHVAAGGALWTTHHNVEAVFSAELVTMQLVK